MVHGVAESYMTERLSSSSSMSSQSREGICPQLVDSGPWCPGDAPLGILGIYGVVPTVRCCECASVLFMCERVLMYMYASVCTHIQVL